MHAVVISTKAGAISTSAEFLYAEHMKNKFALFLGKTLASVAVSSALTSGLYNQMLYLIDEQKADPRITDANGLDALHHLASNNVKRSEYNRQVRRKK